MERIRVLLVDDQVLFVESLKTVLTTRAKDLSVVGVTHEGQEAVEAVERYQPDIVLMDVRMPKLNGVSATRIITERFPQTSVMILTTFDDDDFVYDALQNGAVGYLLKDIPPEELIASIRAIKQGAVLISPSVASKLALRRPEEKSVENRDAVQTDGFPPGSILSPRHEDKPQNGVPQGSVELRSSTRLDDHDGEAHRADSSLLYELTKREREVFWLLAQGFDNQEIGEALCVAEQTVRNRVSTIYSKLGVRDRLRLIRLAASWRSEHGI